MENRHGKRVKRTIKKLRNDDGETKWTGVKVYQRLYDRCEKKNTMWVMNIGKWITSKHKAAQMEGRKAARILPKDGRYAREVEEAGLEVPWLASLGGIHANLYKFGVNAVTDYNPHAGNRRKHAASNIVISSDRCSLCTTGTQTLAHILSYCPISLGNTSPKHAADTSSVTTTSFVSSSQNSSRYCLAISHSYVTFMTTNIITQLSRRDGH